MPFDIFAVWKAADDRQNGKQKIDQIGPNT